MCPSAVSTVLPKLIKKGLSVILLGPPGVCKSSLVWQAAEELHGKGKTTASTVTREFNANGDYYREWRTLTLDAVDLRGIPYVEGSNGDSRTRWASPADLIPEDGSGVLCIEELPQASPTMQSALMEPLLDRTVCGKRIGDGWSIVATGNRAEDRAGARNMLTAVGSRVVIIEVDVNVDDWQTWARTEHINPMIRSFIQYRPNLLHDFEPSRQLNADPRGWERVSIVLEDDDIPKECLLEVVKGIVGEAAASEMVAFLQLQGNPLMDIKTLLSDPENAEIPHDNPSLTYAMCGAIAEHVRVTGKPSYAPAAKYIGRLQEEHAMYAMIECMAATDNDDDFTDTPEATKWCVENRDLFKS